MVRVIARKNGAQVKLYSRPGNDLTFRFPLIVETLSRMRSRSCVIDGEAVACDDKAITSFNRARYRRHDESIFLICVAVRRQASACCKKDNTRSGNEPQGRAKLIYQ